MRVSDITPAMRDFMNRVWQAEGLEIEGERILGGDFVGKILSTRTTAGIDIQLRIQDLDTGETFLESALAVFEGRRNLHIFF